MRELAHDIDIPVGRVRGRVTSREGDPLPAVFVRGQPAFEFLGSESLARTGADGRYDLLVRAGPMTIQAGGHEPDSDDPDSPAESDGRAGRWLDVARGRSRASTLCSSPAPLDDASVERTASPPAESTTAWKDGLTRPGKTRADGSLHLTGLDDESSASACRTAAGRARIPSVTPPGATQRSAPAPPGDRRRSSGRAAWRDPARLSSHDGAGDPSAGGTSVPPAPPIPVAHRRPLHRERGHGESAPSARPVRGDEGKLMLSSRCPEHPPRGALRLWTRAKLEAAPFSGLGPRF